MNKKIVTAFAIAALMGPVVASATIIDLNATTSGQVNDIAHPVTISGFGSTDYVAITQIGTADGGAYNAWNPWGTVAGCDTSGENCTFGWVNNWSYFVNGDNSTTYGVSDGGVYETALLALANAAPVAPLTGITSISFYIADSPYSDNLGGISLDVTIRPGTAVPEPSTLALLGLALAGLGFARRRKLN